MVFWVWVVLTTCLPDTNPSNYFLQGYLKIMCTTQSHTLQIGIASGNWSCCWRDHRWHVAWHSWQLCGSFMSPWGQRISYWTCIHMKTTCTQTLHESELSFMYNMLLYPRNIQYIKTVECFSEYPIFNYIKNKTCKKNVHQIISETAEATGIL